MLSIDDTKTENFCLAYACNEEMESGMQWKVKVCVSDNSTGKNFIKKFTISTKHVSVPLRNIQNQRSQSVVELRVSLTGTRRQQSRSNVN